MLNKIISYFEKKQIKRFNGVLVFYMVYEPKKKSKNVISYHLTPEIKEDDILHSLLKKVADRVRFYYKENPERLEEINKMIEEGTHKEK